MQRLYSMLSDIMPPYPKCLPEVDKLGELKLQRRGRPTNDPSLSGLRAESAAVNPDTKAFINRRSSKRLKASLAHRYALRCPAREGLNRPTL